MRYTLDEMLPERAFKKKLFSNSPATLEGGGGQSAPAAQPAQQTITSNPIAEWAQPTATALIGSSMSNAFNIDKDGNILSSRGFTPFGGATNAQGQFTGAPISQDQYNQQLDVARLGVAGPSALQEQSYKGAANLQMPGQYGAATDFATQAGQGALGTTGQAGMYGAQGNMAGQQAAGMSNMYGAQGAGIGGQAAGMSNMYGGLGAMQGQQGANIGQSLGQMSTNPNAVQSYMNPYIQNALAPALQLQNQQFGQLGAEEQGRATQAGAFGGGREAVMAGLNQQNQMLAQNQLVGNAYNQAFTNAQQQMNTANQAALAGNQQALSGYGMGLQGVGQAGSLGLQGNAQGLQGAQQAGQLGMQGAQVGLQGVGAQQAGYNQANQAASTLGALGGQQLQAQQSILNQQNQFGGQQQQNQQNVINQALQNYGNAQNYADTKTANIMNLVRSTPTTQTQTQYAAPPSPLSQAAGAAGTALAGYKLAGATGGLPKHFETKRMAGGGIASGVPPGKLQSMLANLSDQQLAQKANPKVSDVDTLAAVQGEQAFRANARAATPGFAPGGIVAFAEGDKVKDKETYAGEKEDDALINSIMMSGLSGGMQPNFVDQQYNTPQAQSNSASQQADRVVPSGPIQNVAPASSTGKAFYNNILTSAKEHAEKMGAKNPEAVAHVIATQASAESGWGKHLSGQNNIFGIKGKGTVRSTLEDYGQGKVRVNQEFKDYDSIADATKDAVRLMATSPRYAKVWNARDPIEGLNAQATSGYATAKDYGQLLHSVYSSANKTKKYAEGGITKYFGDPDKNSNEEQIVKSDAVFTPTEPSAYVPTKMSAPVIPANVVKPIQINDYAQQYLDLNKKINANEQDIKAQAKEDPWWALLHGSLATLKASGTMRPGEVHTALGDIGAGGVEGVNALVASKKQRAEQLKDIMGQREGLQKIQEVGDIQRGSNLVNQQTNAVRLAIANSGNQLEMEKYNMLERQFGAEIAAKIYTGQLDKAKTMQGAKAIFDEAARSGNPISMEQAIQKFSIASNAGTGLNKEDTLRAGFINESSKEITKQANDEFSTLGKSLKKLTPEQREAKIDELIRKDVDRKIKLHRPPEKLD